MEERLVVALVFLGACAAISAADVVVEEDSGSEKMGVPSLPQPAGIFANEAAGQGLVDGDCATAVPDSQLTRGPKVNGGFALNVQPKKKKTDSRRVSNADCAGGHYVDGKCLRPFPKPSRTATIHDNMLSPEQDNDQHLYEADIHSFVLKHFGQKVMQNTPEEDHHDMFPGHDLMMYEMNKNGNDHADSISDSLIPVGSRLMTEMDGEVEVDLSGGMGQGAQRKAPSHASTEADTPASMAEEHSAQEGAEPVPISAVEEQAPAKLTDGSEEIAEPAEVVEGVEEEQGDLQGEIPTEQVAEEPGLPPTPTPTPTPNLEELQRLKEEAEEKARHTQSCLSFLADQDITCSGTQEEKEQMEHVGSVSNVQVTAQAMPVFSAGNTKLNFESLVVHCTNVATAAMSHALTDPVASDSERALFAQQLSKYSNAMACASSGDFPSCMPDDLAAVVQTAKSSSDYTCV